MKKLITSLAFIGCISLYVFVNASHAEEVSISPKSIETRDPLLPQLTKDDKHHHESKKHKKSHSKSDHHRDHKHDQEYRDRRYEESRYRNWERNRRYDDRRYDYDDNYDDYDEGIRFETN